MKRKCSWTTWTIAAVVALGAVVVIGSSASADQLNFGITPAQPGTNPAANYRPFQDYDLLGPGCCRTTLDPLSVTSLRRGGTAPFLATLVGAFPGWTFNAAAADLAGTFDITRYQAVGGAQVGADFNMTYIPAGGDPTPAANSLHWIQRVFDNHNITNNPGHGNPEDVVDNDPHSPQLPYYDGLIDVPGGGTKPFSLVPNFEDTPRREGERAHEWHADLYLVEETGVKTVTIYNGVEWGWVNTVPEPGTCTYVLLGSGITLLLFLRRRKPSDSSAS